jgi:hypothetical protein
MRQRWTMTATALVVIAVSGCGGSKPVTVEDPTQGPRKGSLPTCRWVPVAPEWNEPCGPGNHGAKLEVVLREDSRPENAQKQTATCECH